MSGGDEDRESMAGPSRPNNGTCLDTPELSASTMVDNSADKGGPGEGIRNTKASRKRRISTFSANQRKNIRHTRQCMASFTKGVGWLFKAGVFGKWFLEPRIRGGTSNCCLVWDRVVL